MRGYIRDKESRGDRRRGREKRQIKDRQTDRLKDGARNPERLIDSLRMNVY